MQKKRILITGAISLLGKYLTEALKDSHEVFGTYHETSPKKDFFLKKENLLPLDITNKNQIAQILQTVSPQIVIHLAALSNIDYCEAHQTEAWRVNVGGTKHILDVLENHSTHFIFLSSNAVFSGNHAPYTENAKQNPVNFYGKTKAHIAEFLKDMKFPSTILRCTSVFGWPPEGSRDNDVTLYLKKIQTDESLHLVDDRLFNPVYALQAAQAIKEIVKHTYTGTFHVGGKETISRYTFVKKIIQVFAPHYKGKLIPVSSDFFSHLAPRPIDGTLATQKMQQILKMIPQPIISELHKMKEEQSSLLQTLHV